MRVGTLCVTLALVAACAPLPPFGSQTVRIFLGSRVIKEAPPAEVLADPTWQRVTAWCRQQGGASCGEIWNPADLRTNFSRPRDEKIVVFVDLTGVEPDRRYEFRFRWFEPDGALRGRNSQFMHSPQVIPQKFTMFAGSELALGPKTPTGRWRVEIAINGQVEGERLFEIVD